METITFSYSQISRCWWPQQACSRQRFLPIRDCRGVGPERDGQGVWSSTLSAWEGSKLHSNMKCGSSATHPSTRGSRAFCQRAKKEIREPDEYCVALCQHSLPGPWDHNFEPAGGKLLTRGMVTSAVSFPLQGSSENYKLLARWAKDQPQP